MPQGKHRRRAMDAAGHRMPDSGDLRGNHRRRAMDAAGQTSPEGDGCRREFLGANIAGGRWMPEPITSDKMNNK